MATVRAGRILLGSLAFVVAQRAPLARALAIPLALSVLVATVDQSMEKTAFASFVVLVCSVVLQTWFAITTHRIVLLGEGAVPRWGLNRWTMRETSFVLYGLALGALLATLGLILIFIPVVGPVLFAAAAIVGLSCFSLIFPAIAVEDPVSFQDTWELAQGNILTLIICVCLFPLVLSLPLLGFAFVAASAPLLAVPVIAALQGAITVLTMTALSLAYAEIKRGRGLQAD